MKKKIRLLAIILTFIMMIPQIGSYAAEDLPVSVEIVSYPQVTEYCTGDVINTRGLTLAVTYQSGKTNIISNNFTTEYDFSNAGTKTVKVIYTESDIEFEDSFEVQVYDKPIIASDHIKAEPGTIFSLPVYLKKNCGIMGIELNIKFDKESFLPLTVKGSNLISSGNFNDSIATSEDGEFSIIWCGTEKMDKDGAICEVLFYCNNEVEPGEYDIQISSNPINTFTESYGTIHCEPAKGEITITTSEKEKKKLEQLMVVMPDWIENEDPSTPIVSGNDGDGNIMFYYSEKPDGPYSEKMPTTQGVYYLKAIVEATDAYEGGIATCSFRILKASDTPQTPDDPQKPDDPQQPDTPKPVPNISVSYRTHVQSIGWQSYVSNGAMAGTSGQAKRLEGININVSGNSNLGIQYTTHVQSYGWLPWSSNGDMSGTEGEAKRLEAIKIQLTGADKDKYDIYYRVHAQSYGWLGWAMNGAPSGTAGYGKRLEGIQILVVKKGEKINQNQGGIASVRSEAYIALAGTSPVVGAPATSNMNPTIGGTGSPNVSYRTHVQSFGWQGWKYNGQMSGTSGQAKRLEGINIKLTNKPYSGGICYTTHVQSYGWQGDINNSATWKKDGEMAGTSGEAKRLEAIMIKLTGEMADHYDVYYRVHAQSYGWLGWAKNGAPAGTAGYAKRLEGIQIVLVPKGGAAPVNNYGGVTSVVVQAYVSK